MLRREPFCLIKATTKVANKRVINRHRIGLPRLLMRKVAWDGLALSS